MLRVVHPLVLNNRPDIAGRRVDQLILPARSFAWPPLGQLKLALELEPRCIRDAGLPADVDVHRRDGPDDRQHTPGQRCHYYERPCQDDEEPPHAVAAHDTRETGEFDLGHDGRLSLTALQRRFPSPEP